MISRPKKRSPAAHHSLARRSTRRSLAWRRGGAQTAGLVIAVIVGLTFVALIGYFVMSAPAGAPNATGKVPVPKPTAPPDIKSLPPTPGAGNILTGEVMFVQLMDKHDPTRLAGVIESSHVEPLESRRYRVDEPKVWIYMKDGKSVLVEARTGKLYMPDRTKEPEAGTLQGETTVRLFPRQPGDRKVDPAHDEPLLTARMDTLAFDGTIGEISTPDDFVITSPQTDFSGRSLRVLFNESAQRVELLEVKEKGRIVHRTDVKPAHEEKPVHTAAAPAQPADGPAPTPPPPDRKPIETFYDAVFAENVVVTHQHAELHADQFQVWARTLDNQLAPNAIASFEGPGGKSAGAGKTTAAPSISKDDTSAPVAATASSTAPATPPPLATAVPPDLSGDLVLTWTGPLVMKPVATRPAELSKDEIALRFEAPSTGQVTFADDDSGAAGFAETIGYGVSTRELRMAGETPDNVQIALNNSGAMTTTGFNVDLGTGIAHASGRGVLTGKVRESADGKDASGGDSKPAQSVTWNEQADFEFFTAGGRLTGAVKEAMLSGEVLATDGRGTLKSEFMHASFVQPAETPKETSTEITDEKSKRERASRLIRLQAKEGVAAEDGAGGLLHAQELDVAFRTKERSPTPESLVARGNVVAVRDLSVLQSDILNATFEEPAPGATHDRSKVASMRADGHVEYRDGNDVIAKADQLRADVPKQIADLSGDNVSVGKDNSQILGTQLRLDGLARTMEVFGVGRFEHASPNQYKPAVATWTKGMTFDDATGVVVTSGDAQADSYPDATTHDMMRAERVRLEITPMPKRASGGDPLAKASGAAKVQRELLNVTALGANLEMEGGKPASIESRRYAASEDTNAPPALERLMYLEGSRIEMNAAEQVLVVPVPGKMLVVDRRANQKNVTSPENAEPTPETTPPSPLASANARGNALFEWDGKLTMNRREGTMDMTQKVRLTHHRLGDQLATFMECQHLVATVLEEKGAPAGGDPRELRGQLRSVQADGGVFARSGAKEMTADRVDYDAIAETMLARTLSDNPVTVIDVTSPTPLLAKEVLWNLRTDQLEVRKPMPIIAPR